MLTLHLAWPSQSYGLYDVICTIDRVDAISVASQGLFSLLFFFTDRRNRLALTEAKMIFIWSS